jgi:hypothetical protein
MTGMRDEHNKKGVCDTPSEYSKTVVILSFIEDLGVLAERSYLDKNDIFNLMCGIIMKTEEVLREERGGSKQSFANALQLMDDAYKSSHKMNSYNKGAYFIN